MTQNLFFQRNTIKDFALECPPDIRQRSKRSLSVATLKMNPSKFQHREVFDNRIYQKINFFKLDFEELKEKEQLKTHMPSKELSRVFTSLTEILQDQTYLQIFSNYNNHCALMQRNEVKKEFTDTITQILVTLLKKIQSKVEEIISSSKNLELKVQQYDSILKIKRETVSSLEQSRKSTRKAEREKDLKQTNNQLDFNLKKEMLKVDQLQEKLREQTILNRQLSQSIKSMQAQRQAQVSYRESMQYKVKRLKEQLQVAHIIKEQNLADKMKYIMNW